MLEKIYPYFWAFDTRKTDQSRKRFSVNEKDTFKVPKNDFHTEKKKSFSLNPPLTQLSALVAGMRRRRWL